MVENLMPRLTELVTDGIIEVQATNVVHIARPVESREREGRSG
jgi:hypothetical protein